MGTWSLWVSRLRGSVTVLQASSPTGSSPWETASELSFSEAYVGAPRAYAAVESASGSFQACAALTRDGSVITFGAPMCGGIGFLGLL